MSQGFGGIVRHAVHLDGTVPVAVTVVLARGVEGLVDLVTGRFEQHGGPLLSPKRSAWVVEIAGFLARQHLLEAAAARLTTTSEGRTAVSFEPRPKPDTIWWG